MGVDWASVIAGYAAGVSTLVGIREVAVSLPRVKVLFQPKMELIGGPPGTPTKKVRSLTITNIRQRPIQITQAAFLTKGDTLMVTDWIQVMPFTLREGEYKTLVLAEGTQAYDLPKWYRVHVYDSVGRCWPRSVAFRAMLRRRVRTPFRRYILRQK